MKYLCNLKQYPSHYSPTTHTIYILKHKFNIYFNSMDTTFPLQSPLLPLEGMWVISTYRPDTEGPQCEIFPHGQVKHANAGKLRTGFLHLLKFCHV